MKYDRQKTFIPYGRQLVDEADIAEVNKVLRSDWLTTGPRGEAFEQAVCRFTGARYGVAVSSGTAALHAAMNSLGIGVGDEVILPAITFVATANCVVYQGGIPVFADVDADTLLIDPQSVRKRITPKTKAIIAMDYAGQPCDYDTLRNIAEEHNLLLVSDASHSLGARYKGRKTGSLADLTVFSFHPLKHITTGEGGMVVTNDQKAATKMRQFRNHGINNDHRQRDKAATHFYDMEVMGWNYRLSDIQCALGISQLVKLPRWLARRREFAARYEQELGEAHGLTLLRTCEDVEHARHLFVVKVASERDQVFQAMRKAKIGVNVHYRPVHLHSFYRLNFETGKGICPVAEKVYEEILTLPLHAGLTDTEVEWVIENLKIYVP